MIKDLSEITQLAKIEIDLTGPKGNALYLMGQARVYAKQLKLDDVEILEDMKSGDYEHLIGVFDEHFGFFVDLFR